MNCKKCGKKLPVPTWKTCNHCDNPLLTLHLEEMHQYNSTEYKEKVARWSRENADRIERMMEAAREPLTIDDFVHTWPEYREFKQCWCCGMELTRKQQDYCSGMCEKMYSLYPSQFGLYRKSVV